MFIRYHGNNVHALGHTSPQSKMNQSPETIYALRPGWNEFPTHVWKQYEKHPQIQSMLKKGAPDDSGKPTDKPLIELMAEKITVTHGKKKTTKIVGQDDEPIDLTQFEEKLAIKVVKGTYNREILQRWADEETRGKVVRALKNQMEPLLSHEEKDSEDEDDAA